LPPLGEKQIQLPRKSEEVISSTEIWENFFLFPTGLHLYWKPSSDFLGLFITVPFTEGDGTESTLLSKQRNRACEQMQQRQQHCVVVRT
jgi:hypothetical protein